MKVAMFCLVVLAAVANFSCRQSVESSHIPVNEKTGEIIKPAPTPIEYEEIDIIEQFSRMSVGNNPEALEFRDYKIEPVLVKKKYDEDSPVAGIYDAVLTKNGRKVARFESVYHPLGNFMSFGLYPFLRSSEKQLFIVEESHRYDRELIINLYPKYEVLFDAADFEVLRGYLRVIDMENDGEKEITLGKNCNLGFIYSNSEEPWVSIIFKYDAKARKYLPASHKYPEFTLKSRDLQEFMEGGKKIFSLKVFMAYIYAGKEAEAWKIFDEAELNFPVENYSTGKIENKQELKENILKGLAKDKIYKFIKKDLMQTD